jgi:hypothetical protein
MSNEVWELTENPSAYSDYHLWADDLPARKFYLFLAEVGRRVRHLMTEPGPVKMIDDCERCAEGLIDEGDLSDLSDENRTWKEETDASQGANQLFYWVADRFKVHSRGVRWVENVFPFLAAVGAGLLTPDASYETIQAVSVHPVWTDALDRTRREWGDLVRDIYGPNPFHPVTLEPAWRTAAAVSLARVMYDTRDFAAMPILADALQDAGCDSADILAHCRGSGPHVRGCWVVDLVLGKA